jgi:hypothetical protein
MPDCAHRNQLVTDWNEAVLNFSKAVSLLKASNSDRGDFAKHYHATEEARLHAENASAVLELHRTDHGFIASLRDIHEKAKLVDGGTAG